ncbi:MAG: M1 family metallopeptidase [Thermoanaerobaculia bacterium]|nr:M1 family metallopeptidase [Thermoanaerobaculia bacterium]
MIRYTLWLSLAALLFASPTLSSVEQTKGKFQDKFRQLDEVLPTANAYRTAGGEPGHQYWQQKVDYDIDVRLIEDRRRIEASQRIRYTNNSPDTLRFLWLQLDQNRFRDDSLAERSAAFADSSRRGPRVEDARNGNPARLSLAELRRRQFMADNALGYELPSVRDAGGELAHTVVGTNLRVDLRSPLKPGETTEFEIDFAFNILDENSVSARAGYEHFPDDEREGGNDIFLLAQWFPRLHAYTDYEGWTNKEFLGRGEFTLEFGDYTVDITVPEDHIVSSTGELQNPDAVLTSTQRERLESARTADAPVFIVTAEEALENEREGASGEKTWRFQADKVRDFAWASSRKFIWDAQGYQQGGEVQPEVMAMSFYPKEGEPLWSKYSTASVIHTMKVYSRFSFDYPYPVAQSVNGPVGGMEYPMITFNGPRTELQDDGDRTYSLGEKRYLVGVIIHEIGHIYFPMTVNSDERQWTWMDEGLNSFLDAMAGWEWDPEIPWNNEPRDIVDYMKSETQVPIMTQSDSVLRLGPNAYAKPAAALMILRETILGRELFDFAFREYSRRWMFKRPAPADFFRTMEEASGVDLDWFWRGWFYTTDHVDISIDRVWKLRLDTKDPDIDYARRRQEEAEKPDSVIVERNRAEGPTWVEQNPDIRDFYDENDRFTVTNKERNKYQKFLSGLEDWEREVLERALKEDRNYYVLEFNNHGGLVMPILLELTYEDGTTERLDIPAEIWRRNARSVKKLVVTDRELTQVVVDPNWETADTDVENNHYPRRIIPSRLEAFKSPDRKSGVSRDLMQDIKTELKTETDEDEENEDEE